MEEKLNLIWEKLSKLEFQTENYLQENLLLDTKDLKRIDPENLPMELNIMEALYSDVFPREQFIEINNKRHLKFEKTYQSHDSNYLLERIKDLEETNLILMQEQQTKVVSQAEYDQLYQQFEKLKRNYILKEKESILLQKYLQEKNETEKHLTVEKASLEYQLSLLKENNKSTHQEINRLNSDINSLKFQLQELTDKFHSFEEITHTISLSKEEIASVQSTIDSLVQSFYQTKNQPVDTSTINPIESSSTINTSSHTIENKNYQEIPSSSSVNREPTKPTSYPMPQLPPTAYPKLKQIMQNIFHSNTN